MRQYGLSLCAASLVSTPYLGPHFGADKEQGKVDFTEGKAEVYIHFFDRGSS